MNVQSLSGRWQFRQAGSAEWLPATVPGGVHTDLLALGRIPDPFVGCPRCNAERPGLDAFLKALENDDEG